MQTIHNPDSRFFRVSPAPFFSDAVDDLLISQGVTSAAVTFWPFARRLVHSPFALGRSLAAFFGYLYIQDPSSMLPPLALNPPQGAVVLDMCASPGGKTGIASQLVGPSGLVVANEPNHSRRATLQANILRQNLTNVVVSGYPAENIPLEGENWPFILLDAPCSGWGTEKKHPLVKKLWTPEKVTPLVHLQRQLLQKAGELLAPGGRLVYSTCTTNLLENEEQVALAVSHCGLEVESLSPFSGFVFDERALADGLLLVDSECCQAQGFFIACLRKPGLLAPAREKTCDLPGKLVELGGLLSCLPPGLEAGKGFVVNENVFFASDKALSLLGSLRWQGYLLGRCKKDVFSPQARARCLISGTPGQEALVFEQPHVLENILAGSSLSCTASSAHLPFYWKNLPLGWLRVKGRRCIWTGRA